MTLSNAANAVKTANRFSGNPFFNFCFSNFKLFYSGTSYVWILFCFPFTFSCPSLTIPGFTHPVAEFFLSDVHEMLGQAIPHPTHPQGKRFKPDNSFVKVFFFFIFLWFCQMFSLPAMTLSVISLQILECKLLSKTQFYCKCKSIIYLIIFKASF